VERICPHILKPVCALKQALVAIKIQRCNRRGTSERMRRMGVAVKKFDRVIGIGVRNYERSIEVDPTGRLIAMHQSWS